MTHFAITGVKAGKVSPRRDVDLWYSEAIQPEKYPVAAIQLSLFTRGLQRFQDAPPFGDEAGKLSYYRIAGIHGWPNDLGWDGVDPLKENDGWNFCVHGNTTFPTWHRPYLALYEQLIYDHMKDITTEEVPAEKQKAWNDAADEWRLPYWDYAWRPKICIIASLEKIEILDHTSKTNKLVSVNNPMYSYRLATGSTFGDESVMGELTIPDIKDDGSIIIPSGMVKGTSRYAIKLPIDPGEPWINGVSDNDAVSKAFGNPQWPEVDNALSKATGTIAENIYKLVTTDYFESWRAFASTKYYNEDQNARLWLSLENVHNMAHNWSGGTNIKIEGVGHMSFIELSAFDPIFWLHHCFIDMVVATWQTRTNNKYWFNDQVTDDDPKATDPLPPFYKADQSMFTSDDVKDFTTLNYTYDLLVPTDTQINADGTVNEDKYHADLAIELNKRYSTTRSEMLKAVNVPDQKLVASESIPPDYIINVTYDKHALKEPYNIHLFAGPLDPSIASDSAQPNRLGTIYTFSRFNPIDTCPNCKAQIENGHLSTGQITITGAMIKDVLDPFVEEADGLAPPNIEQYLQRYLTWKIVTLTGREIPPQDLARLKITLFVGHGHHSEDTTSLSTYKDYRPLYAATAGKPGGASEEIGCY